MTTATSSSAPPIVWIAGIAVTLFSLVGIAALTGVLPSRSATPDAAPQTLAAVPAATAAPAAAPAAPAAVVEAAPARVETPAPVVRKKPVVKKETHATLPPANAGVPPDYVAPAAKAPAVCANCGVIADIREVRRDGEGTGLGAIGGGIVGGALANNVGKGTGRTVATIAGMVGGGMLGNHIEKTQRATVSYDVSVRMEDGSSQLLSFQAPPPWRIGDAVKVANGTLVAR